MPLFLSFAALYCPQYWTWNAILEFKTLKHSVQSEIDKKPTVSDQPLRYFRLCSREPIGNLIPCCHVGDMMASNSLCDPMDMLTLHLSSNEPMVKCFCLCDVPMENWIVCDEPSNRPMSWQRSLAEKSKHPFFSKTRRQLHLRKRHHL